MAVANILAYYHTEKFTTVKKFKKTMAQCYNTVFVRDLRIFVLS
jgi:hypothetical protein